MGVIKLPTETRADGSYDPEDELIPRGVSRDYLWYLFDNLVKDHIYDSKMFIKHFADRRASMPLFGESLLDTVRKSVCYDSEGLFDIRLLIHITCEEDRILLIDVASQVSERFVNNPNTPKSPLTLAQFKVLLAYRLNQVGF